MLLSDADNCRCPFPTSNQEGRIRSTTHSSLVRKLAIRIPRKICSQTFKLSSSDHTVRTLAFSMFTPARTRETTEMPHIQMEAPKALRPTMVLDVPWMAPEPPTRWIQNLCGQTTTPQQNPLTAREDAILTHTVQ